MGPRDWKERWEEGRIGFHQTAVNPWLQKFFSKIDVPPSAHCLVPFCGKSRDMVWIAEQGHTITGIEVSPIARAAFFDEQNVNPNREELTPYLTRHQHGPYHLIEGNFFHVTPDMLPPVDWIYDRASLISLPSDQQQRYVDHLHRFLPVGGQLFLIVLEYDRTEMEGPPFSTPMNDVDRLFSARFHIESWATEEILGENPRFRERGLTRLYDHVFSLTKTKP